MHAPVEAVRDLIAHAEAYVSAADGGARLHRAEQVLMLVRLAADCGARRGELAALRLEDLDGDITLHRLRHAVATVLVGRGDLLQAQYRLGHRDASTTLRIYSHVLPLTDTQAAATLDRLYP